MYFMTNEATTSKRWLTVQEVRLCCGQSYMRLSRHHKRVERNETKGRFFHLSLEIVELHIYAEVLKLLKMRKE